MRSDGISTARIVHVVRCSSVLLPLSLQQQLYSGAVGKRRQCGTTITDADDDTLVKTTPLLVRRVLAAVRARLAAWPRPWPRPSSVIPLTK